ncbi:MAG: hypothetical protein ACREX9_22155 [Gammaproteobacteria bacterium]
MNSTFRSFALTAAAFLFPLAADAIPITYNAQLFDGVPVTGVINQPNGNFSNPVGAEYFSFFANTGSPTSVTVDGDRLDGPYDMSFWVFSGLFADTSAFGASFDSLDPGFIDVADDETAPNLPGPFGDPLSIFNAPLTGFYTSCCNQFS